MAELDRIKYEGFSKEYVLQRLQIALHDEKADAWNVESKPLPPAVYTATQAMEQVLRGRKGISAFFIRFAYQNKDTIKNLPYVGKKALEIERKLRTAAYTKQTQQEKDLTLLLSLDVNEFITAVYNELLEREPDREGFLNFQRLMCKGASREAIIYMIASSSEFAGRFRINHLDAYKKAYRRFILKSKVKKIPVIGWFIWIQNMPEVLAEFRMMEADWRSSERETRQKREAVFNEIRKSLDETAKKAQEKLEDVKVALYEKIIDMDNQRLASERSLKTDVDWIKQVVASLSEKVDVTTQSQNADIDWFKQVITAISEKVDSLISPEIPMSDFLVVNGSINVDSYLEHANSILEETAPERLVEGNYYQLLEALFRGSEENIRNHQKYYLDYMFESTGFRSSTGEYFLDAGCGRGEFLSLLKEHEIPAKGIDIDKVSVDILIGKKYEVYCADVLEYLNGISDNELTGFSSFQVIEHLSRDYLEKLINLAVNKIADKGVILLETLNPYCYSNHGAFYIDPTHICWHSPDSLKLDLEYAGFKNAKIIYYAPIPSQHASKIAVQANYAGYAIVASVQKP